MKSSPKAPLFARCWFCWLPIAPLVSPAALADNWPQWRGPEGTGVSADRNLPLHWSTNENVRWRSALPDRGNSTPIVWSNRVFITQAIEKENRRTVMCFNRADGQLLWQTGVTWAGKEARHETNPLCSASPATDGGRVIASFASAGLYCYDFSGREFWPGGTHLSDRRQQSDRPDGLASERTGRQFRRGEAGRKTKLGRLVEHADHCPRERPGGTHHELARAGGGLRPQNRPGTLDVRRVEPAGLHLTPLRRGHRGGDGRIYGQRARGDSGRRRRCHGDPPALASSENQTTHRFRRRSRRSHLYFE